MMTDHKTNWKHLVKRFSNIHLPGSKPDIFVFSTARSGSTFLNELLHTQNGVKICDEPMNIRNPFVKKAMGINGWEDLMPSPFRKGIIEDYFNRIRHNQISFLNQKPFSKNYRFITNRMVFKILHGGEDIINWFKETFSAKIVYLIRHPIAVTLSRNAFPRLPYFLSSRNYRSYFNIKQLAFADNIMVEGSDFEKGMLSWCLQNFPPLNCSDRSEWILLTYEELTIHPETVIKHLSGKLDLPHTERMLNSINKPSRVIYKSDPVTKQFFNSNGNRQDRTWLIQKWKNKISPEQEAKAFEILDVFNMEAYLFGKYLPSDRYLISSELI